MAHIDFETHESHLQDLVNRFRTAQPFEYLVIDNFLCEASLQKLMAAIPEPDQKKRSSDYMFAKNKFEDPTFANGQNILMALRDELLSDRFAAMLSVIFGKTLFVDPAFVGGGIHQGGEGSFLDMHADFSRHPANRTWLRELNILLYLNPNYDESFGGHLELEHAQTHQQGRVAPLLNRMVVMLTKGHTLHGYKRTNFPKGQYRTSLAAYAYSIDQDFAAEPSRSTLWKPKDASPMKAALAALAPSLVKAKNAVLGSNTVRRAKSDTPKR